MIDRVMAFVCPRIILGRENHAPLLGPGSVSIDETTRLKELEVRPVGPDLLISGYVREPF